MTVARFKDLCWDATDPGALAGFWGPVLSREARTLDGGDAMLIGSRHQQTIWFNRVPEPKAVKHRMHLDVHVASIDPLIAAGATVLDADSFGWTVLADPEGGEFCAFAGETVPEERVYELSLDCADPERLAAWWAEVLGGRVRTEAEVSSLDGVPDAPFESLVFAPVPEPKTGKNRIHPDVVAPDVGALVAAGAHVLRESDDEIDWTVLADPEGNEFCAFLPA